MSVLWCQPLHRDRRTTVFLLKFILMKRLYLMRHAKAEKNFEGSDINRRLTGRGRKDSVIQAEKLAAMDVPPAWILCSEAKRALETSEIISENFNPPLRILADPGIYHGSAEDYLEAVLNKGAGDSFMLAAHNPAMEQLASLFDSRTGGLGTAEIAWFDFDIKSWKELTPLTRPAGSGWIRKL